MALQINAVNIPSTIYNSGKYSPPDAEVLAINGEGVSVESLVKKVYWTWPIMSPTDYDWWTQTILVNAKSRRCAARLLNEVRVETAYTTVIVKKPTIGNIRNGNYYDVSLEIEILA